MSNVHLIKHAWSNTAAVCYLRGIISNLPKSCCGFASVNNTRNNSPVFVDVCSQGKSMYFCTSAACQKRDKYALPIPLRQNRSSGGGNSPKRLKKNNLALFTLETSQFWDHKDTSFQTAKMSMISNSVHHAVITLLSSPDIPTKIQEALIDIVKVQMTPDLNHATVFWKLDSQKEDFEKEREVQELLEDNIEQLQMLLPTFHTMTSTPSIRFKLYEMDRKHRKMEEMFSKLREDSS